MQALSKRIHYGKFVAEAKFLAKREQYSGLIEAGDADGLMRLLTDKSVEAKVHTACHASESSQDTLLTWAPITRLPSCHLWVCECPCGYGPSHR